MKTDTIHTTKACIRGIRTGASYSAAGAILTGAALTTTTSTSTSWLIFTTVTTLTVVSWPVVLAAAAAGGAIGGIVGICFQVVENRRERHRFESMFEEQATA